MRKIENIFLGCLVLLLGFFSCKKDKEVEPTVDLGYNYYPDEVGRYVIYEVDSIYQDDPLLWRDTTRYILKEVIASTFVDNSGRTTLRLERFYKMYVDTIPYDSIAWVGPRVWYANRTSSTLERVEENNRYLRLVFPAKEGEIWNGNVYNTLGEKEYEITSTDQPETINGLAFDSVVTVKQFEQINFIERRYEEEKFARNVGLIYKVRDSLYDGGTNDTVGYTFRQKIISYGK